MAAAIRAMAADPFQGDIMKLEGGRSRYRRRVGDYRMSFRVDRASGTVGISAIVRRTSTTY
jgi:mRNA-degrading endonuclease RelE of RelBE toxin-antitoxin system